MDKNDVREWFEAFAMNTGGDMGIDGWAIRDDQLELACEAIAQAHEQELRNAQLAILPCGHHASNVVGADAGTAYCEMCELEGQVKKLQAKEALLHRQVSLDIGKVAVMADLLRRCADSAWEDHGIMGRAAYGALPDEVDAALQSAPKVLWSGKGQARQAGDDGRMILVDLPAGAFLLVDGTIYRRQEVDVIVLEGPNALQEQSKAELPDSECSVNEGRQPKGKQEGL